MRELRQIKGGEGHLLRITWLLFLLGADVPCADHLDLEISLAEIETQLHLAVLRTCGYHSGRRDYQLSRDVGRRNYCASVYKFVNFTTRDIS